MKNKEQLPKIKDSHRINRERRHGPYGSIQNYGAASEVFPQSRYPLTPDVMPVNQVDSLVETIATKQLDLVPDDVLFIQSNPETAPIARRLVLMASQIGCTVKHYCEDPERIAALVNKGGVNNEAYEPQKELFKEMMTGVTKLAYFMYPSQAMQNVSSEAFGIYNTVIQEAGSPNASRWVLMKFPSTEEAMGYPYNELVQFYLRGGTENYSELQVEQQRLIDHYLNNAKEVHIYANEQGGDNKTDLRIRLDREIKEGKQKFHNSAEYDPNVIGGEVFTAPRADGINGALEITYPIDFGGRVIPNLTLEFKEGLITNYSVDSYHPQDSQWVLGILDRDKNEETERTPSRSIGEIGFGNNRLLNPADLPFYPTNVALVEKYSGTVHIAVGRAIQNPDASPYDTDNGV